AVPDASEVHGLVWQLGDHDDLREAVDALHERVLDGFADATGEREELIRREVLVTKEHDEVLEPGPPYFGDRDVGERGRDVHAPYLGTDGPGDRLHTDRLVVRHALPPHSKREI